MEAAAQAEKDSSLSTEQQLAPALASGITDVPAVLGVNYSPFGGCHPLEPAARFWEGSQALITSSCKFFPPPARSIPSLRPQLCQNPCFCRGPAIPNCCIHPRELRTGKNPGQAIHSHCLPQYPKHPEAWSSGRQGFREDLAYWCCGAFSFPGITLLLIRDSFPHILQFT